MICDFLGGTSQGGKTLYRCKQCGRELWLRSTTANIKAQCTAKVRASARPPAPVQGPGTELKLLLHELAVKEKAGCGCAAMQAEMNILGVNGCREKRAKLAARLQEKSGKWTWLEKSLAVLQAAKTGIGLRLNPLDLYGSLVDEACRRSDIKHSGQPIEAAVVKPVHRTRIPLDYAHPQFNNSIIEYRGKRLMAYRSGWANASIVITELDAANRPTKTCRLSLKSGQAQEDPRLWIYQGELYVSFSAIGEDDKGQHSQVAYARLRTDCCGWNADCEWMPRYSGAQRWEKNWAFFESGGELYAVYSIQPHRVLKIEGDRATLVSEIDWGEPLLLRGGAPPIPYQGELYHYCHAVHGNGYDRQYTVDLYTFDPKPPFHPARRIKGPVLCHDPRDRWVATVPHVVYCCGAYRDAWGDWQISFGNYDKWSETAQFSGWDIEGALLPVRGGTYNGLSYSADDHGLQVWKQVAVGNEYRLPDDMTGQIVVDIGQHIGSFSHACLTRGAKFVLAVEPNPSSREHAERNLGKFGDRCQTIAAYCLGGELQDAYGGKISPVCNSKITLDSITAELPRVDLLKLDCEGPEHDIVANSELSKVRKIVGECHQVRDRDMASLATALNHKGFAVQWEPNGEGLWHFWATRNPESDSPP